MKTQARITGGRRVSNKKAREITNYLREFYKGLISPEQYVEDARRKSSPLHDTLTWDDARAAHAYRLDEARRILRSIKIEIVSDAGKEQIRAFHNVKVTTPSGKPYRGYSHEDNIINNKDQRRQVINDLIARVEALEMILRAHEKWLGVCLRTLRLLLKQLRAFA